MKRKIDLYATLGVKRDATQAEIRKAYRDQAKKAHPDAGGKRAEFEAIQTANVVLANPEKRARYDATGDWEDAAPLSEEQRALAEIGEALMGVLYGDGDPSHIDLVAHICSAYANKIRSQREHAAKLRNALDRNKRLRGRFRKRDGGDNLIEPVLKWQGDLIERQLAQIDQNVKDTEIAIEFLKSYEFQQETLAQYQRVSVRVGASTSSSTW